MQENPEADHGPGDGSWTVAQILPYLRAAGPLSSALSEHIAALLRSGNYTRASRVDHDTRRILDASFKAALSTLTADDEVRDRVGDEYAELRRSADYWAREGVSIIAVINGVHDSFRIAVRVLIDASESAATADLIEVVPLLIDLLEAVTATVVGAYVEEYRTSNRAQRIAEQAAVTALLGGRPVSSTARLSGISVAESYTLLALAVVRRDNPSTEGHDPDYLLRRTQRRMQAVLDNIDDAEVMSLLGVYGGTILIAGNRTYEWLANIIERISCETGTDIVAAYVESPTAELPSAVGQAHQLIDVAQRLERPPGLYRFRDLALPYQLMQPGPGRDHLVEVLAPLRPHPELVHTLRVHIQNDLHRQRSARQLHLHANSLDNRLKRIGELTGLSVTKPQDLATLQAALVVSGLTPLQNS